MLRKLYFLLYFYLNLTKMKLISVIVINLIFAIIISSLLIKVTGRI